MKIAVCGSGLVSVLGFNAAASLAALRAGISGIREIPMIDYESGELLRGAKVPLPHWWEGLGKWADLVAPAIHECLTSAPPSRRPIPWLVAVADPTRQGRPERLDDSLFNEVANRLGVSIPPLSRLIAGDEVGGYQALQVADQLIASGQADFVVVAGVDSFVCQTMLDDLLGRRRIMSASQSNGFFPGEAGSAVLICAPGSSGQAELRILGTGYAVESATIESTMPMRAHGLTSAVRQALHEANVQLRDVAWRLTDLTGEHYRFKEAAIVAGRLNGGAREVPLDLWHPIEYLGAIGAAILPCLLAQTMHAHQLGYAPGALALCHVGNDAGERAALVVRGAEARSRDLQ